MFKLFAKCEACRKRRIFIAKRHVVLPVSGPALSKGRICGKCHRSVKKLLAN